MKINVEALKLIPENERANVLIYLDRDTINYLKLTISEGNDMDFIFNYLEEKIFNYYKVKSFRLFQKKKTNNNYYYYNQDQENNMEINESYNDFKLLYDELNRKITKYKENKNKICNQNFIPDYNISFNGMNEDEDEDEDEDRIQLQQEEESEEDEDFDIKKLPKQCRWCVFKYMNEKTKEALNYIPNEDRFCCFRYLDKKTKDEFQSIPSEDRFRCFKYLGNRDSETLIMVPEEDSFRCIIFLDKKENKEENK